MSKVKLRAVPKVDINKYNTSPFSYRMPETFTIPIFNREMTHRQTNIKFTQAIMDHAQLYMSDMASTIISTWVYDMALSRAQSKKHKIKNK